jgi:hypothetical protein
VWKAANSEQAHLNSREVRGSGPLLGGVKVIEIILESKVRSWEHRVVTHLSTKSHVAIGGQLLGGGKVIEIILKTVKLEVGSTGQGCHKPLHQVQHRHQPHPHPHPERKH